MVGAMKRRATVCLVFFGTLAVVISAGPRALAQSGTAQVRQAPKINGRVEGSIRQLAAENVVLNGGASVTGDLFVPGTPQVLLNGKPDYGGTLDGTGAVTPTDYKVTLNGGAELGHVIRRTDPVPIAAVEAPPPPIGTRTVTINQRGGSAGDFVTLRDLTLSSDCGQFSVPPGTYGAFSAKSGSGFTLGVANSEEPGIYHFQSLTLSADSSLLVVGPVVITIGGDLIVNTSAGEPAHPEWLTLRLATGGLSVAGNRTIYARLEAPNGTLTLNGGSQFVGAAASDRLVVNGNAVLRLVAPERTNKAPIVSIITPANGTAFTAPATITLTADAVDADGEIVRVEFFEGTRKLGEDASAPFGIVVTEAAAGSHTYIARAFDDEEASTDSGPVTIVVASLNQPPAVELTSPPDGALFTAPVNLTLKASATDPDSWVTKVEFFQGHEKVGEDPTAPYELSIGQLIPGTYRYHAVAHDSSSATGESPAVVVTVLAPNTAPTVTLVSPADGSSYSEPASLLLEAVASDSDGAITRVDFYREGIYLGTDAVSPYNLALTGLTTGSYNFLARATDDSGSSTDSAAIKIAILPAVNRGLPFAAGFEVAQGYSLGALEGQEGWAASGPVVVTGADSVSGAQAALIPGNDPSLTLARTFDPHPAHPVVFLDLFVLAFAADNEASAAQISTRGASRLAIVRDDSAGRISIREGAGDDWRAVGETIVLDAEGFAADWTRLTLRLDHVAGEWDLYIGGRMAAAMVGFEPENAPSLGALTVRGHGTAPTLTDDILIAFENPVFADADRDGMDDVWESAHGLDPSNDDRRGDPDRDGLVNVLEHLAGTHPANPDSDGDGMADGWEWRHGLDPGLDDAAGDLDGDGVSNHREFLLGRNPTKGAVPDTLGLVNLRVFQPGNLP